MQPIKPKPTFILYKTNVGCFVKIVAAATSHPLAEYTVNGVDQKSATVVGGYAMIDGEITDVKRQYPPVSRLTKYRLKYPELEVRGLPLEVDAKNASYDDDGDLCLVGISEPDLYESVYEMTEGTTVGTDFDIKNMGEFVIENPTDLKKRSIKMIRPGAFAIKPFEVELASVVAYDDITSILTPEFALSQAPCKLTSHQMYQIVRQHLIENLDMRENSITSNYDFCFTVKKRVHTKPFIATDSYFVGRRSKTKQIQKSETLVEIFEMTYAGYKGTSGYNGYTCIPEMTGDSLEDLYQKLTGYLSNLIDALNSKVTECECCGGTGHLIEKAKV